MAKSKKPTNAFGFRPDSFETAGLAEEQEIQVPDNETAEQEIPVSAPVIESKEESVILIQTDKRENKAKHVHFLAKPSMIEELDECAAELGVSRSFLIETAVTHLLASKKKKV